MRPVRHLEFRSVYAAHAGTVERYLLRRAPSRQDAEDLTQATFERALAAWDRFDPARAGVECWLLAIAQHLLIDLDRRRRARPADPVPNDELDATAEAPEPRIGPSPELAAALGRLTGPSRHVLALRFGAELTGPEIATRLGLSVANVQQIQSRSLRRLRAELSA